MTVAFYKVAREVDGFDKKLEKFKDELFAFCEQLGYNTVSYVYSDGTHNRHFVKFTIKDENNSDYNVILFTLLVSYLVYNLLGVVLLSSLYSVWFL